MKAINVGIMPQDQIRARILGIAKGDIKPKASDPKVWFTSMRSLAEVLRIMSKTQLESQT